MLIGFSGALRLYCILPNSVFMALMKAQLNAPWGKQLKAITLVCFYGLLGELWINILGHRWLPEVFRGLHGCAFRLIWGMSASRIISLFSSPAPSAKRIPVSDTKATNHLRSSSIVVHKCCTLRISSTGIGGRLLTPADLSKYMPTRGFLISSAYSEMAKLNIALMELITRPTLDPTKPLAIR